MTPYIGDSVAIGPPLPGSGTCIVHRLRANEEGDITEFYVIQTELGTHYIASHSFEEDIISVTRTSSTNGGVWIVTLHECMEDVDQPGLKITETVYSAEYTAARIYLIAEQQALLHPDYIVSITREAPVA